MTIPNRTIEQRREALTRANEIRTSRAQLKRDIRAGIVSPLDVLATPPEFVESMKVWDLLLAVPKIGPGKADRALRRTQASPSKTIGGLTLRQRSELARNIDRKAQA